MAGRQPSASVSLLVQLPALVLALNHLTRQTRQDAPRPRRTRRKVITLRKGIDAGQTAREGFPGGAHLPNHQNKLPDAGRNCQPLTGPNRSRARESLFSRGPWGRSGGGAGTSGVARNRESPVFMRLGFLEASKV